MHSLKLFLSFDSNILIYDKIGSNYQCKLLRFFDVKRGIVIKDFNKREKKFRDYFLQILLFFNSIANRGITGILGSGSLLTISAKNPGASEFKSSI